MKKLMKKIIPFLFALALFVSATPWGTASDTNYGISPCGDEEDFIDLGTLTRN